MKYLLSAILTSFIIACGPALQGLGPVAIPVVKDNGVDFPAAIRVAVQPLQDRRADAALFLFKGERGGMETSVGELVRGSIERHLSSYGVKIGSFDVPVIKGAVTEWQTEVVRKLPTITANSRAQILLEVFDKTNQRIFSGRYSGEAVKEGPSLSNSQLRAVTGDSMAAAVSALMKDVEFQNSLARGQ